jgi:hypothetical protein
MKVVKIKRAIARMTKGVRVLGTMYLKRRQHLCDTSNVAVEVGKLWGRKVMM